MTEDKENVIEFLRNQNTATAFLTQGKYIGKIKKLAEKYPEECSYIKNSDGSIIAHFPTKWIKISPPKVMNLTEEQKQARAEHMKNVVMPMRKTKKSLT